MDDSDAITFAADRASYARGGGPRIEWMGTALMLLAVLALFLAIRIALFQPFTIPSASMEPTLVQGDYIVVSKFDYGFSRHSIPFSPRWFQGRLWDQPASRGDIVVFKLPRDGRTDYIKRVIGLPGDRIQMKGGVVYLNGKPLAREEVRSGLEDGPLGVSHQVERFIETLPDGKTYVTNDYGPDGDVDNTAVYVVPPGHYFVMGDNRDNSQDSRYPEAVGVGYVPAGNLVGKAEVVLFSLNGAGFRSDRFFKALN